MNFEVPWFDNFFDNFFDDFSFFDKFSLTNFFTIFLTKCLDEPFWQFFFTNFFFLRIYLPSLWQFFLTDFFEGIFWRNFLTDFFYELFYKFFWRILVFWKIVLTIASFRIEVPSILFNLFLKVSTSTYIRTSKMSIGTHNCEVETFRNKLHELLCNNPEQYLLWTL